MKPNLGDNLEDGNTVLGLFPAVKKGSNFLTAGSVSALTDRRQEGSIGASVLRGGGGTAMDSRPTLPGSETPEN